MVTAIKANAAHEIHTKGIAAQGKKNAMTKGEYTAITPDKVHGHGHNGIAEDLANQGERIIREVQWASRWYCEVQDWDQD